MIDLRIEMFLSRCASAGGAPSSGDPSCSISTSQKMRLKNRGVIEFDGRRWRLIPKAAQFIASSIRSGATP